MNCFGCGTPLPPRKRASGRRQKWCSDKCRKDTLYSLPCIDCGTPTSSDGSYPERCRDCAAVQSRTMVARRRASRKNRGRLQWTDEAIFAAIRSIAVDGAASTGDYQRAYEARRRGSMPSMPLIYRRFDTWGAAVRAAGLQTKHKTHGPRWDRVTREGCLLSLLDCVADLDRLPSYDEYATWARRVGGIDAQTVRIRFGSWMNALEAAAAETGLA